VFHWRRKKGREREMTRGLRIGELACGGGRVRTIDARVDGAKVEGGRGGRGGDRIGVVYWKQESGGVAGASMKKNSVSTEKSRPTSQRRPLAKKRECRPDFWSRGQMTTQGEGDPKGGEKGLGLNTMK